MPGAVVRPVLVRERRIMETDRQERYGALVISYATGEGITDASRKLDPAMFRIDYARKEIIQ